MYFKLVDMATLQTASDALCDAIIEIAESRVAEFRDGDKFMRFINVRDASSAMLTLEKVERAASENDTVPISPTCEIDFLL